MDTNEAVKWLEQKGTRRTVEGMARYGIQAKRAFGVTVGTLRAFAKSLGKDQTLSLKLWETGWYEARLLAAFVGDPQQVTRRQMNAWASGFENWADCDTVCFCLFDRSPFAWELAPRWAVSPREFVKRGGFVLMACLAAHDKVSPDERFLPFLPMIEKGASDDRNFVKKGVSWALRMIGRRSRSLHAAALPVAKRLSLSKEAAPRWIGKDALKELTSPKVLERMKSAGAKKPGSAKKK